MTAPIEQGYTGSKSDTDTNSDLNATLYIVQQMLNMVRTNMMVKVVSVNDPGGVNLTGTVDVTPMLTQLNSAMKVVPHEVMHNLIYFRLQGGLNAIILFPKVGDIGMAAICDRDHSTAISTKAVSPPSSLRTHDMADGIYFGGLLNGVPARYVKIDDAGIVIEGAAAVTIHGAAVVVNAEGSVTVNSPNVTVPSGDVTASGISLIHHTHTGVSTGTGNTGAATG